MPPKPRYIYDHLRGRAQPRFQKFATTRSTSAAPNTEPEAKTTERDGSRPARRQPALAVACGVSSARKRITLDLDHNGFDEISSTTASEQDQNTKVTTYTYWLNGLLKTRADDREEDAGTEVRAARRHEFRYDVDGRPSEHLDLGRDAGVADDKRITYTYSPTGRERERVVEHWVGAADTGSFQARHTTQRAYFANGLPQTLRTYGGPAEPAKLRESHTVAYRDPDDVYVNGHRTSDEFFRESPNPSAPCGSAAGPCTQRWAYDGADRLIEENDGHSKRTGFKLTPAGGIKRTFNAANPAEVISSADFDGTRMSTFTKSGVTTRLHYDIEGNLDCTTTADGTAEADCNRGENASAKLIEDHTYDYRNRLTAIDMHSASKLTRWEHDALDRPILEVEESGTSTTRHELSYVGATRHLAEEKETGRRQKTRSYSYDAFGRRIGMTYKNAQDPARELTYAHDVHGNVSMMLDDTGATKAAYGYSAYGQPDLALTAERLPGSDEQAESGEQVNPFRYSDKRSDSQSGTIDMGARQFSPELGQFLQQDRYDTAVADLGLTGDPLTDNRYGLAGGNPVSFVELDGHVPAYDSGTAAKAAGDQRQREYERDANTYTPTSFRTERSTDTPASGPSRTPHVPSTGSQGSSSQVSSDGGNVLTGAWQAVKETGEALAHPRQTAESLVYEATHFGTYERVLASCEGKSVGHCVGYVGFGVVGAKGTTSAVRTSAAKGADEVPRYVYRGGSNSPDNLTPRPQDVRGLSTFENLEAATPPGGKAQVIDTTRLRCLIACPDAPPPGHVSIRPRNPFDLQDWMSARGTGRTHPLSRELQDAIVDVVRRPK